MAVKIKAFTEANFRKFIMDESSVPTESYCSPMDEADDVLTRFNKWRTPKSEVKLPARAVGTAVIDADGDTVATCASAGLALAMVEAFNASYFPAEDEE